MAATAGQAQVPGGNLVLIQPRDVDQTQATDSNGNIVIGGHLGVQQGCPGVQSFIKKFRSNGELAWQRSASATKDCDGDGQIDGGLDFFEGLNSLDPAYIIASTVRETVFTSDRFIYEAGQILVAWEEEGVLTAGWGALFVHRARNGRILHDIYVGVQPTGAPSEIQTCVVVCAALGESAFGQWGGRSIELLESQEGVESVLVSGWEVAASDQGLTDRDVFLASLSPDFATIHWGKTIPHAGKDDPLDIVMTPDGDAWVTGYQGFDHNVFVAHFYGQDGALAHAFLGSGPQDNRGDEIAITAQGDIEVKGRFMDSLSLADQILTGEGETEFRAVFSPTLELILAEVIGEENLVGGDSSTANAQAGIDKGDLKDLIRVKSAAGFGGAGVPVPITVPEMEGDHQNPPEAISLIVGVPSGEVSPESLATSDDGEYLHLSGHPKVDFNEVVVDFEIPIYTGAKVLTSVMLEFGSEYCTSLTVLLGGGTAPPGTFYELQDEPIDVCPFDEPSIYVQISPDDAELIGYGASLRQPDEPVMIRVIMEIYGFGGCAIGSCISTEDDTALDSAHCNSEYP